MTIEVTWEALATSWETLYRAEAAKREHIEEELAFEREAHTRTNARLKHALANLADHAKSDTDPYQFLEEKR